MTQLTLETFKRCAPKNVVNNITQDMVDSVNNLNLESEFASYYRENIVGYASVLSDGRFKITDYLNAVRWVSFKLMCSTNIEAYAKTFPDKYSDWVSRGVEEKTIHSYSTAYSKNKLVNLILEQTLVPFHVINQEIRQKALDRLANLMVTARSEKVQADSAASILVHTKPPETSKLELDVNIKESSAISDLHEATKNLVAAQRSAISTGKSTAFEVAQTNIIDAEVVVND
tara:strand:- start:1008 stop:1697 length:690 start_codon:yes stop_codon:yes gene_type:complete